MHAYEVGQPYHAGRATWPESFQYNYRQSEHELVAFLARPTSQERHEVTKGRLDLALFTDGDLLALLIRFGSMPWSDALYSWHLVPADQQTLPETDQPGQGQLLQVVLVDAATGIIRGLRAISMPEAFARELHSAIRDQSGRPWVGQSAYDAQIAALYRRYPTSDALVRDARARCTAGTV